MSRNTRSGACSAMAFTASKPFVHSPTTSTPGCVPRYSRSSARAGASSSTSSTRMRSNMAGLRGNRRRECRQRERDAEPFTRAGRGQLGLARPEYLEPAPDVLESHAFAPSRGRVGVYRILHHHAQERAVTPRLDPNGAALPAILDAVLDGVLDERLQQQRRYAARERVRVHRALDAQPVAEARLFDVEVALDQRQLLAKRHGVASAQRQRATQEISETLAHAAR